MGIFFFDAKRKTSLAFGIVIAIVLFIEIYCRIDGHEFFKKPINGKIIEINNRPLTSVKVDDGSVIVLDFIAKGLEINDSVSKAAKESSYWFFKRDSTGQFRQIRWKPVEQSEYIWEFQ